MSPDEQSGRGQTETCPFCGRPFKRLKSHITHCKMVPVAKDTKSPKTSQLLTSTPPEQNTTKKKMTATKQQGPTDTQPGSAPKPKPPGFGDALTLTLKPKPPGLVDALTLTPKANERAGPAKKSPRGQDPAAGRATKVRAEARERGGEETAESAMEPGSVRGPPLTLSNPTGKRPTLVLTVAGGRSSYADTTDGPIQAPGEAALGKRQPKPKPSPQSLRQSAPQSPPALRQSAPQFPQVPQSSPSLRRSAPQSPPALQRPPRARVPLWGDVPSSWPPSWRTGGLIGYEQGWTKTSVWEHIKEAFSCRSPFHGSRDQGALGVSTGDRETTRVDLHQKLREPLPTTSVGAEWGWSRDVHCPLGLEWMPALAMGYRGIGHSMVPLRTLTPTDHVQLKVPPTQALSPGSQGPLTERGLMEVRLAELPSWLKSRLLLTPREAATMLHRGWLWYYRKYIDVRRGGAGGITMLLAGYCVLSYIWSYPHLKCERWRKYH